MAVHQILQRRTDSFLFADAAQAPDGLMTLAGLAAGAGRLSTEIELAPDIAPRGMRLDYRATARLGAAPANTGLTCSFWLVTSDGIDRDNDLGAVDAAAVSSDTTNLTLITSVINSTVVSGDTFTRSGTIWIPTRFMSVVAFNGYGVALHSDTSSNRIRFTRTPDEIQ